MLLELRAARPEDAAVLIELHARACRPAARRRVPPTGTPSAGRRPVMPPGWLASIESAPRRRRRLKRSGARSAVPRWRAWVAERQRYMVGFLLAEAHPGGFGDLVAGVREAHRRRGLGRALAVGAMSYFAGKQLPAVGLHWGPDGVAGAFYRALGFTTERVYLFFERSL